MVVDIPDDMIWPDFDRYSKCVKCGWEISKPEPVPEKPVTGPAGMKVHDKKVPAKAAEESPAGPAKPMQLPVQSQDPTCSYCNGEDCPMFDDEVDQHMHQFCDCCGYEWIAKTLDAS